MFERADQLIHQIRIGAARPCHRCTHAICPHEALMSVAAGFAANPHCEPCLALELGRPVEQVRAHVEGLVEHRDCYGAAWDWADGAEGSGSACALRAMRVDARRETAGGENARRENPGDENAGDVPEVRSGDHAADSDSAWDAGDAACGDLLLELRGRMAGLPPGHVLKLRATDAGAREDIPSWCRLTGHALVRTAAPDFWLRRRP